MRRKVPQSNAKLHHLIPQAYMRRFSHDGKRVHVYDLTTGKYRFSRTRTVAAETEFYTVVNRDGGKERWAEARLGELDQAVSLFDELENGSPLTRVERWHIAFFVGFAETRGKGFREDARATVTEVDDSVDRRFAEAYSAMTGVWLDPWMIEKLAREEMSRIVSGADDIGVMTGAGFELAIRIFWSDWLIGTAPDEINFITSDRPIGLLQRQHGFGDDPFDPDLIKVFPLSPKRALFLGKPSRGLEIQHGEVPPNSVRASNLAIARRADRNLIGCSEADLRAVVTDAN